MSVIDLTTEAPSASLPQILEQTDLRYHPLEAGAVAIPFAAKREESLVVLVRVLGGELALFSVALPETGWLGQAAALRCAVRLSLQADFVKVFALPSGELALACEVPVGVLTPSLAEGLVRGLVELADVKKRDLADADGWQRRILACGVAQAAFIPDRAVEERERLRRLAVEAELRVSGDEGGLTLGLEIAGAELTVVAPPTRRVISLIAYFGDSKPKGTTQLRGILELNRLANVAKVGLDNDGDIALLYEVPAVTPDIFERLTVQFVGLILGLRALGVGR